MEINNHKPYSRCRVWRCDVTTSNSIQNGGALVVNILVFDLRVQLQHCTYQRKTLLFASIKVSTFICKREISGLSSPFKDNIWHLYTRCQQIDFLKQGKFECQKVNSNATRIYPTLKKPTLFMQCSKLANTTLFMLASSTWFMVACSTTYLFLPRVLTCRNLHVWRFYV